MKIKINLSEKQLEIIPETQFETAFIWEELGNTNNLVCKLENNKPPILVIKDEADL